MELVNAAIIGTMAFSGVFIAAKIVVARDHTRRLRARRAELSRLSKPLTYRIYPSVVQQ
jgi:hypothetical protein